MGRPLKIQKYSTGSGNSGAAVVIDEGYPNFGSLTAPVVNSADTLDTAQFYGVVGGASSTTTSATFPRIVVEVNITLASGSASGAAAGYIIRQKGAHKYLVGDTTSLTAIVASNAYIITAVGDCNWAATGVANAGVGTIFTATAAIANTGTGTANLVGICILSDAAAPTNGNMSIAFMQNDSSELYISKLTNKWMLDWTGGSDYTADAVVDDVRYLSNFFTDEGTAIKSGTTGAANVSGQQNLVDLAIVQNATS